MTDGERFRRAAARGVAAALRAAPPLERAWSGVLRAAWRDASRRFAMHGGVTAAAGWQIPDADSVWDALRVSAAADDATRQARERVVIAALAPTLEEFGISLDLKNPLVGRVLEDMGRRVTLVTEGERAALMREIQRAFDDGLSIEDAARRVADLGGPVSETRARTIARTEITSAVNGASTAAARITGAVGYKQWLATVDGRTRATHVMATGSVVGINDAFDVGGYPLRYPGDPDGPPEEVINCVAEGTLVEWPMLRAVTRRWYEGDLVRVRFAGGDDLAVTPNHPILRSDGRWVAAQLLREGHYCVGGRVVGHLTGEPDVQRGPAEVGEVYRAAQLAAAAVRVRTAPPDLHGDAVDGEVEVVPVDGYLLRDADAASDEQVAQLGLAFADRARLAEARGDGLSVVRLAAARVGGDVATASGVRGGGVGAALLDRPRRGEQAVRFHPSSWRDAGGAESPHDGRPGDGEAARERRDAFAASVTLREVVGVERVPYAGHVYNLDTGEGWYIANTIASRNCRCTLVYPDSAAGVEGVPMPGDVEAGGAAWEAGRVASAGTSRVGGAMELRILRVWREIAAAVDGEPRVGVEGELLYVDTPTPDGRELAADGGSVAPLPVTLYAMIGDSHDPSGVSGPPPTVVAGQIESIDQSGNPWTFVGSLNSDAEGGARVLPMIEAGDLRGVSADLQVTEFEVSIPLPPDGLEDVPAAEEPANNDGSPTVITVTEEDREQFRATKWQVRAATIVGQPAWSDLSIRTTQAAAVAASPGTEFEVGVAVGDDVWIPMFDVADGDVTRELLAGHGGMSWDEFSLTAFVDAFNDAGTALSLAGIAHEDAYAAFEIPVELYGMPARVAVRERLRETAASAGLVPVEPPRDWFEMPEPDHPVPLTVTDEGRVYGHVAEWGACHTGSGRACVSTPQGHDVDHASYFHAGEVRCADGSRVATGPITLRTEHPPLGGSWTADRVRDHYSHTGCAAADVHVVEGKLGVWCAGALRPSADPELVRELTASGVSGDWRLVGPRGRQRLALVGILSVNSRGFPVPRELVAAAGEHDGVVLGVLAGRPVVGESDAVLDARIDRLTVVGTDGLDALLDRALGS